jgi:hypothetical protein
MCTMAFVTLWTKFLLRQSLAFGYRRTTAHASGLIDKITLAVANGHLRVDLKVCSRHVFTRSRKVEMPCGRSLPLVDRRRCAGKQRRAENCHNTDSKRSSEEAASATDDAAWTSIPFCRSDRGCALFGCSLHFSLSHTRLAQGLGRAIRSLQHRAGRKPRMRRAEIRP